MKTPSDEKPGVVTARKISLPFMHPVVLLPSLILLLSFISLIGWALHLAILTSILPHFATMKPNTAISLGMLAVCCRARVRKGVTRRGHLGWLSRLALAIAMVLACGSLGEYLSGRSFGLDGLILGVPLDRFGDPPGRMSLGTALCLTFTGVALGLLDRMPRLSVWLLMTANVITVSALLGFVINRGPLFNVSWLRSMAVPTALSLLTLGVATLATRPERGPVCHLFPDPRSGRDSRWQLLHGIVLSLMGALPAVVAMQVGIPEAVATFLVLAVLLYSAQTWFYYMQNARITDEPETKPVQ
ncbi:hypothetical protein HDF16_002187 [Granulicella aggregans]|uniref:Uncharacterized protein n=1 Tax=Granulicella aggregans TaxID=474949 RepID=A0A7W8E3H4_9BACT|nr:hypothetical protein [Granulicella aggregans]MBB5057481.1 hypothetical protein [Granulicella aggregans]